MSSVLSTSGFQLNETGAIFLKSRENTILLFKALFLGSCSPSLEKPIQHVIKNPSHVLIKIDKVVYLWFPFFLTSFKALEH